MKKKTRNLMTLVLVAVFAVSTFLLLRQFRDNAGGEEAYGEALAIASGNSQQDQTQPAVQETTEPTQPKTYWIPAPVEEDDPHMEEMAAIDLAALREVNQDVLGWIRIPNSRIDYPLMQGEDNDHYLNHTWDQRSNSVGSIFLECLNRSDLMDYNTIIYGHNMADGSMFAGLHQYTSDYYWRNHPYIYIATDAGVYRYEVFAAYKADTSSPTYGLSFNQQKTRDAFLLHAQENSVVDTGILPEGNDRVLTLSTCSGAVASDRWVVQARLRMVQVQE